MFFRKKKRSIDDLSGSMKEIIASKNERQIQRFFDELEAFLPEEPQKVEGLFGFALLLGMEIDCGGLEDRVGWFLGQFPNSVVPVRAEVGARLADGGQEDRGTFLARDYLHDLKEAGTLAEIGKMQVARRGASLAFLVVTAVYTKLGARSYSKRVLEHASTYGVLPEYEETYRKESARLDEELRDEKNARLNQAWEQFFAKGMQGEQFMKWCDSNGCPQLAHRVELIWRHFQTKSDYSVGPEEILQQVKKVRVRTTEGEVKDAWALV